MAIPTHPLTHHEILALIEPFARRGRQADLAASDRLARRLVFKPIDHADGPEPAAPLREILELEALRPDLLRLTRVLRRGDGPQARLQTEGPDPAELLARIESVPLQRQFRSGEGFAIAESHRLDPAIATDSATAAEAAPGLRMILTDATVDIGGVMLRLTMPTVRGYPADLALTPPAGESFGLPEDFLAVLGRRWRRLDKFRDGWRSSLRLRGTEPGRSRWTEAMLERVAAHLARTLAEPPARFHERFARARWGVALRRAVPLLVSIVMIVGAMALPLVEIPSDSWVQMVILQAPPLLLVALFCMRETPRIEIPPLPRRSAAPTWRPPRPVPVPAPAAEPADASSSAPVSSAAD